MYFIYVSEKSIQVKNNINTFKKKNKILLNINFIVYENFLRLEFISVIVIFVILIEFYMMTFF